MATTNAQRTRRSSAAKRASRSSGRSKSGSVNGSSGGTRTRSRPSGGARASRTAQSSRSRSSTKSRSHATRRTTETWTQRAGNTVERAAKSTGQAVGQAASKVKGPAIAGGAALAGLAGGLALAGSRARSRRVLGVPVPRRDRLAKTGKSLGQVAGQVGSASRQLALLTEEVRRTREQAERENRRSPVEVLLSGLTNRKLGG
jgi:hypothetical protein